MRSTLVTAPAVEPLSLADAKLHLRVTTDTEDSLISTYIKASRLLCEQHTQRAFITQTWRVFLDAWPATEKGDQWWDGTRQGAIGEMFEEKSELELPRAPLQSITHVKTYDTSDVASVFDPSKYGIDTAGSPGRLFLKSGYSWPTPGRSHNGIEIQFVAGYGATADEVPEDVKTAITMLTAHIYENRGDTKAEMPSMVQLLLSQYRMVRL
jgi:gp6-like head-tail connector protein